VSAPARKPVVARRPSKLGRGIRLAVAIACVVVMLGASGCGGGKAIVQTSGQTCGRELSDLDDARKRGLLSEREYTKLRNANIKRCSRRK
jgi:hypothetical protein